ncbi:MAG: HAD-IA family hydrolase [Pseudohongiellaceae bacterium]
MLVIFDWDGTLLNSLAKIAHCMQLAAEDAGLEPCPEDEIRGIIGLGLPEAVATLYPELTKAPTQILSERYSHHFQLKDSRPCEFYPGVRETLEVLKSDGHHIAVATGKSRRGLDRVLGNLGWEGYFHATRCADETRSKPHPMMLSELLAELDTGVEDALMVGDTEFDLSMAGQLGMRRVGVSYGAHPHERLSRHQPEAIVDNINELLELIAD